MATKLTRLTHKIQIQPHLVAKSCNICSSRSRRPVRNLLDKPSYILKSTNFEVPHYALSTSLLKLPPSYIQIFSSAPCSQGEPW